MLHSVLGMTGQEASSFVGNCAHDTGGRRQLLAWLVEFYGSQGAARAVVLKCPVLAGSNLENCERDVAALRRLLAEDGPQLTEGELVARVLDIFSRQPIVCAMDLGGPLMTAKLDVFAAGVVIADVGACALCHSFTPSCQPVHACATAGIPPSEATHKIGYLFKGLPRMVVHLPLIKAHGLPLRLSWLLQSDEVFCDLIGRTPPTSAPTRPIIWAQSPGSSCAQSTASCPAGSCQQTRGGGGHGGGGPSPVQRLACHWKKSASAASGGTPGSAGCPACCPYHCCTRCSALQSVGIASNCFQ